MGIFSKLLSFPDRGPVSYVPVNRRFHVLDAAALRREFRIDERARTRAVRALPPTDTTALDEVETEIARAIEEARSGAIAQFLQDLRADNASLATIDIENEISHIKATGAGALADFQVEGSRGYGEIAELQKRFLAKKAALQRFMEDNRLTRPAHTRSPGTRLLLGGIIAVIAFAEFLVNGTLLGESQAGGLIAGAQIALVISAANVAPAWFAGAFGFRMRNRRQWDLRLRAYAGLLLWWCWLAGFNLAAAHYRDAILALGGGGEPERRAIETLLRAPMLLGDIKSYLLFCLGVGTSLVVAVDAYFFDDTCYGYGDASRARDAALDDFHDTKTRIQDALRRGRDDALRAMQVARQAAADLQMNHANALTRREETVHQFRNCIDHLEATGRDLINVYRDINRAHRKTPAPLTFATPYAIHRNDLPAAGEPPAMPLQRVQELVSEATRVIDETMAKLNREYLRQSQMYTKVEDII